MSHLSLVRKAIKLFPHAPYTDKKNVKHARLAWMKAVFYLRANGKYQIEQKGSLNKEKNQVEFH